MAMSNQEMMMNSTEPELGSPRPSVFLSRMLIQQQHFTCLHWLCHFKVIFHVPLHQRSTSYEALAAAADVPENTLKSVCRMAMTAGFLCETPDGEVAHTALSSSFVADADIYNWMMYMGGRTIPTMARFVDATERWGDSTDPRHTAYSLAMGTDLPFFEHVNSTSELADEFSAYMKSQAASLAGTHVHFVKEGFDWLSLGKATVVDVGGGGGQASIFLAENFPELTFIVQDLPKCIDVASTKAVSLPRDIRTRIHLHTHDFFTPQPVRKADVYLLRMILHDWPHQRARDILRHLAVAMAPHSRILIMDMVLPRPGSMDPGHEAALRQKDLTMKQGLNAKERELDDWHDLIAGVNPRLRVLNTITPPTSHLSMLEVALHDAVSGACNQKHLG